MSSKFSLISNLTCLAYVPYLGKLLRPYNKTRT